MCAMVSSLMSMSTGKRTTETQPRSQCSNGKNGTDSSPVPARRTGKRHLAKIAVAAITTQLMPRKKRRKLKEDDTTTSAEEPVHPQISSFLDDASKEKDKDGHNSANCHSATNASNKAATALVSTDASLTTKKEEDLMLCGQYTFSMLRTCMSRDGVGSSNARQLVCEQDLVPISYCGYHNPKRCLDWQGLYPGGDFFRSTIAPAHKPISAKIITRNPCALRVPPTKSM